MVILKNVPPEIVQKFQAAFENDALTALVKKGELAAVDKFIDGLPAPTETQQEAIDAFYDLAS